MMVRNGNGAALCPGTRTGDRALPIVTINGVRSGKNYRLKAVISGAKARAKFDTFSLKSVVYS